MGEDEEDLIEALRESMRRYENNLFTSEYAMEVPRDTIYYIKPSFSDKVTMEFSFKPKYKRVCKI